ncbi:MAG: glutamate racemase [Syntrophomonadaceae bacterium]|nr:glutamate racemase [Syntrophomonadaceae bacterium]
MRKSRPIGIFDSGVGGLTVVKCLLEQLPNEDFIYFGDTAHVPYGDKTRRQLFGYAHHIISFLLSREVKAIVVACGTHSSITLPVMSKKYQVPMLGVVKAGARSATRITRNGKIGVLATQATVNSLAYTKEIKKIDPGYEVIEVACPRFVPLVEMGKLDGLETREAVREYASPLLEYGVDTLVLGCTHYPFLVPVIKEFVGDATVVIDIAWETVEELKEILIRCGLFSDGNKKPVKEFYVSGSSDSFYDVGKLLIGDVIKEVHQLNSISLRKHP